MWKKKYFKEHFDKILNDEFHGDKHAMRISSKYNRRLYDTALKKKWTTPMDVVKVRTKYSKDEFMRILGTFGGNSIRMTASSPENRLMVISAKYHGWIPRCKAAGGGMFHSVYLFSFPPVPSAGLGISVYVGITSRPPAERRMRHAEDPKSAVRLFATEHGLDIPPMTVVETNLPSDTAAMREQMWIDRFRDIGWNVINRKDGGDLGGYFLLRTSPEEAKAAIDRFSTLSDFSKCDPCMHNKINRLARESRPGWKEVRDYMRTKLLYRRHEYSYEECVTIAARCRSASEMSRKHPNAYQYAYRRGFVRKMCEEAGLPYLADQSVAVVGTPVSGIGNPVRFGTIGEAAGFAKVSRKTMRDYVHGRHKVKKSLAGYCWKIDDSKQNYKTESIEKKGNPK